jgi:serine/threonine protein kinase
MSAENKPAADDRLPGRKVGGYTITRRVGQGGMGVVYEAKHERIGQRAAVKVLHKELSSDEKVLQRFFNEAKAISVAQHSSIVKIFDYGQLDDGTAYILMEFLEGEPLLNRMERAQKEGTGLTLRLVVELGRQISAALALIHQKGIVHRELRLIDSDCLRSSGKLTQRRRQHHEDAHCRESHYLYS